MRKPSPAGVLAAVAIIAVTVLPYVMRQAGKWQFRVDCLAEQAQIDLSDAPDVRYRWSYLETVAGLSPTLSSVSKRERLNRMEEAFGLPVDICYAGEVAERLRTHVRQVPIGSKSREAPADNWTQRIDCLDEQAGRNTALAASQPERFSALEKQLGIEVDAEAYDPSFIVRLARIEAKLGIPAAACYGVARNTEQDAWDPGVRNDLLELL